MICANINAFRSIGGTFPSQTKVIHCVFSGSDVGSKLWLLCSLLYPTTKHLSRLGAILVYTRSGVETMANCSQLTQGGSKVKRHCQSTIVGGALVCETPHSQEAENGLIWERGYYLYGLKKKTLGGFLSIQDVCVQTLPTHIYVQTTCKSEFCIRWPL